MRWAQTLQNRSNYALQRSVWRLQKQVQQFNIPTGSNSKSPKLARASNKSTPIKKAENLIRKSGLSPRTIPKVKKALVLQNVMLKGLKTSSKKSQKQVLTSTSMHMKSTRCNAYLAKTLKVGRNRFGKNHSNLKTKTRIKAELLRRTVVSFMKRPDNASCCPGKNDKVKVGTKSEQKYILCDTLKNLHRKFLQENSSTQICFALFCKLRPKFIRPVSYAARRVCLCQKHQNMALKLKALRNMKLNTLPLCPDDLKDTDLQEANQKLQNINQERVARVAKNTGTLQGNIYS